MTKFFTLGMLLIWGLLTTSCASMKNQNIREECEQSIKNYNRLLRWHEVENAGLLYIEPEGSAEFEKAAESLKKRDVTITDYRIRTQECLPEKGTAEALTEFDYYILPSNRIKTLNYRQLWTYHENGDKKGWRLKSGMPLFE